MHSTDSPQASQALGMHALEIQNHNTPTPAFRPKACPIGRDYFYNAPQALLHMEKILSLNS
jgi:hypothetical protein